jgi:hypothetical protein
MNGATEWFKTGGKFDDFISVVDKGKLLPYITVHTMTKELIEDNCIRMSDSIVEWELAQSTFGYYYIGIEILKMLGYLKVYKEVIIANDPDNILLIGRKVSISDKVYDDIKNNFNVFLGFDISKGIVQDNKKKGSRLRKVVIEKKDFDSELFLLLNSV